MLFFRAQSPLFISAGAAYLFKRLLNFSNLADCKDENTESDKEMLQFYLSHFSKEMHQ